MTDVQLTTIPRDEFARVYFDYKAGQHVVFGGPTQRGKTTLAFQLLQYVATPELPAYVAVSKPEDKTSRQWGEKLGFRRVSQWPPRKKLNEYWEGSPPGYLVWPQFGNINDDVARASRVTADLINDRYTAGVKHKHGILVMDDTMIKSRVLGLDGHMVTVLTMAGAMGLGIWVFVQKPTDAGRTAIWSFSQSEHLFLARDPDKKSRDRYDEIGGVDPKFVSQAVNQLEPYQFLYVKRTGSHMCIVDAR